MEIKKFERISRELEWLIRKYLPKVRKLYKTSLSEIIRKEQIPLNSNLENKISENSQEQDPYEFLAERFIGRVEDRYKDKGNVLETFTIYYILGSMHREMIRWQFEPTHLKGLTIDELAEKINKEGILYLDISHTKEETAEIIDDYLSRLNPPAQENYFKEILLSKVYSLFKENKYLIFDNVA